MDGLLKHFAHCLKRLFLPIAKGASYPHRKQLSQYRRQQLWRNLRQFGTPKRSAPVNIPESGSLVSDNLKKSINQRPLFFPPLLLITLFTQLRISHGRLQY